MLWDRETGQARLFAGSGTNQIHWLVFSRDGRYLAAADNPKTPSGKPGKDDPRKTVRVWAVGAQKEPRALSTDGKFPKSLVFSADGKTLMAGYWEGVKLWQLDRPGGGRFVNIPGR
jgi:sugar lactone lactonase YvrE